MLFLAPLAFWIFAITLHAENATHFSENWQIAHHGEEVFDRFYHNGYVTFDGTTIHNASIDGYTHIRFGRFGSLRVNGHAKIEDSELQNRVEITGKLLAINCGFKDELICTSSDKIVLSHCRAKSVTIKASGSKQPVLELADYSEIEGPIQFESGNGLVIADQRSTIRRLRGGILQIK